MTHSAPENLLADTGVSATDEAGGCSDGQCSCGANNADAPELDVKSIPGPVRHTAIFGALESIAPGASLILIAPHEPVPLLEQLAAAQPGVWTSTIDQAGPEVWRVRLTRAS